MRDFCSVQRQLAPHAPTVRMVMRFALPPLLQRNKTRLPLTTGRLSARLPGWNCGTVWPGVSGDAVEALFREGWSISLLTDGLRPDWSASEPEAREKRRDSKLRRLDRKRVSNRLLGITLSDQRS